MRLDEFIACLDSDLRPKVEAAGGQFHVARDPLHPFVILAGGNYAGWVAILNYAGGTGLNREDHPHGMESARVELFVGTAIDLRADPGAWLFKADGERESVLQRLNTLRGQVFTIAFLNGDGRDPGYAENEGTEQATLPDGTPLRAFKLTVSWPLEIEIDESAYRFVNAPAGATPQKEKAHAA